MTSTRKKLLLREDEAWIIECALNQLITRLRDAEKEYATLQEIALNEEALRNCKIAEKKARENINEAERILKLVQDAGVTETEVEL